MKKLLFIMLAAVTVSLASCEDKKENIYTVTVEYHAKEAKEKADDTQKPQELAKKQEIKCAERQLVDIEYLKKEKVVIEIKGYEYDSMEPQNLTVKGNATVKLYYKAVKQEEDKKPAN